MSGEQLDRVGRSILRAAMLVRLLDSDRRPATVEQVVAGLQIELSLLRDTVWIMLADAGLPEPAAPVLTPRHLPPAAPEALF